MTIRVDYAGPGGTCEGMRMLGLEPIGIEWDAAACATRAAAGHLTIRADLATYRPHHAAGSVEGYWASPPCQTFSTAGRGAGRGQMERLVQIIDREDWDAVGELDSRTRHVVDASRTALELHPQWVGMEQVPGALPIFLAVVRRLRFHGYSAWAGILNAADFGVPQTRRRCILMASRIHVASPPAPTHAEVPGLFGLPRWVSAQSVLSLPFTWAAIDRRTNSRGPGGTQVDTALVPVSRPAPTLTGMAGGQWIIRSGSTIAGGPLAERSAQRPAFTVTSRADLWTLREGESGTEGKLTPAGCLALQSFGFDYPVQGNKGERFRQIGDAVPPLLAAHVVSELSGARMPALEVAS